MKKGEKDAAMAKDPVPAFRLWLIKNRYSSEAELAAIESSIEREIDSAVDFALSSATPELAELRRDVFAEEMTV